MDDFFYELQQFILKFIDVKYMEIAITGKL